MSNKKGSRTTKKSEPKLDVEKIVERVGKSVSESGGDRDPKQSLKELGILVGKVSKDSENLEKIGVALAEMKSPTVLPYLSEVTQHLKNKGEEGVKGLKQVLSKMTAPPDFLSDLENAEAKRAYGYFQRIFNNMDRVVKPSVFEMGWLLLTHAVRPYYICMANARVCHVKLSQTELAFLQETKIEALKLVAETEKEKFVDSAKAVALADFTPFWKHQDLPDNEGSESYAKLLAVLIETVSLGQKNTDRGQEPDDKGSMEKSEVPPTLTEIWLQEFLLFAEKRDDRNVIFTPENVSKLIKLYAKVTKQACQDEGENADPLHECKCKFDFAYQKKLQETVHSLAIHDPWMTRRAAKQHNAKAILKHWSAHPTVSGYKALVKLYEQNPCDVYSQHMKLMLRGIENPKTNKEACQLLSLMKPEKMDPAVIPILEKKIEDSKDVADARKYLQHLETVAKARPDLLKGRECAYLEPFVDKFGMETDGVGSIVRILCQKGTTSRADAKTSLEVMFQPNGTPRYESKRYHDILLTELPTLAEKQPQEMLKYREFVDSSVGDKLLQSEASKLQQILDNPPKKCGDKCSIL